MFNRKMVVLTGALAGALLGFVGIIRGDDATSVPRPVPITRPEMKQLLEDMKSRKPRIPLPELTDEEKSKLGERVSYESRLRYHYMGGEVQGAGGGSIREPDANMTLDRTFKTQLFWIVCRTNNCQYCQGHQEWGLASRGMKEDEIAALDGDWLEFKPGQQAAFAFARKITFEPHHITDKDIDRLRKHYSDLQILEMLLSVSGNNSINRWKEGVGVPQSKDRSAQRPKESPTEKPAAEKPAGEPPAVFKNFVTPTSEKYKSQVSKVAAIQFDEKTGAPTHATVCRRPALESRSEVEEALATARKRTPRLPLVAEDKARALLSDDWPAGPLPQWVRLLANFPREGKSRILTLGSYEERLPNLKPLLKAQVSWIIARQDRAWYAAGQAKAKLKELGWSDDQVYKLDGSWDDFTPAERSLFTLARKLAASPVVLTDDDVAAALKLTGPREVVQLVSYTTGRALFDRITEAAGLRLEN